MAGDRDYIPIIRHLKKHGRTVRVASFRANVSGDLLTIVGEPYFIDASEFIDKSKLAPKAAAVAAAPASAPAPQPVQVRPVLPVVTALPIKPAKLELDPDSPQVRLMADYEKAVSVMLTHFGDKREVWMTPYLNKLRQEMPQLAESERKALIGRMVDHGVVKVEKRKGEPFDFSVLVINWNHLDIHRNNG